jgi:hypothetical protein
MTRPIIRIKRSTTPGSKPSLGQLQLGELALNTNDIELYARRERVGFVPDIVRIGAGATVTNILYVTKDGNDNNTGKKLGDAKATIKSAVDASETGTVIKVSAGIYLEDNPIALPSQVSVVGDSLREVTVSPLNPDKDLFYVANGNYVAEMSYTGSLNPGKAIFTFNPEKVGYFNQSPYIQNCTNFIPNSIGMKVDGTYAIGPLKSMVLDSYTQYNQGGIGVSITNEGYAQLVSLFTICDDIAVFCGSGGACDLTNSNSSFGNYALVADGVGPKKYTGTIVEGGTSTDQFVIDLTVPTLNITNAIYDHTTGILTAYTDQEHNFKVGVGVSIVGLAFTCSSDGGITQLEYPTGNYGYIFEPFIVAPGRYYDAYNSIQANKKEIQDKALASIALNYPDFYLPGDEQTTDRSRYYDSYRLIKQNQREIADKAASKLAVGFPSDFYFPDEPETNERSRFYDGSGLIQKNRQEIIDKSLAAVAIAHSDFYFPGDNQTNARSRYADSYRLIQNNKDVIVSIAFTSAVNNPGFAGTDFAAVMDKCKRDTGLFIDAVSTDIFTGGNSYSIAFAKFYFDADGNPTNNGLLGEESESIYVFEQAKQLMKDAITNTLVGAAYSDLTITVDPLTGSNTNPNSCANVRSNIDNLVGIITSVIDNGNLLSLPPQNFGYYVQDSTNVLPHTLAGIGTTSSPGGLKCARDLGYFIDAIATDLFTGGNKYSRDFTLQYFDAQTGQPISNGLINEESQSITAFNAARDLFKRAVTNQLNIKTIGISSGTAEYLGAGNDIPVFPSGNANSCIDVQNNIDTLVAISTNVIGVGTTAFLSTFNENLGISTTNKCIRDTRYFVDAIATDLFVGGNYYASEFTKQYFNNVGSATTALLGEESESVYVFMQASEFSKKAITNQLNIQDLTLTTDSNPGIGTTSNKNPTSCTNVRNTIDTLTGIVTSVIVSSDLTELPPINEGIYSLGLSKCRRDIGYLIDYVSLDVRDYTNENTIDATKFYFNLDGSLDNSIENEIPQTITSFESARDYMKLAINNQLNKKNFDLIEDPTTQSNNSENSCSNVKSYIDNLVGIVTTAIFNADLNISPLPSVSAASTVFSAYVGTAPFEHYYVSGGTAKIDVIRPFNGQVVYFEDLYYTVKNVIILNSGSGYSEPPTLSFESPEVEWGIPAQAVAEIRSGSITNIELVSSGRGYKIPPKITITGPQSGINTATAIVELTPTYYVITEATEVSSGITTITVGENVPYFVGVGTEVPFYKQSRVLASGHSLEYIGTGIDIDKCLPRLGGVPIPENETDARNGGLVVYTSTDQAGNFKIGDGVIINQTTGSITGDFYSKSLFATMTPFILALGGD